jgi:hypothetical protein
MNWNSCDCISDDVIQTSVCLGDWPTVALTHEVYLETYECMLLIERTDTNQ